MTVNQARRLQAIARWHRRCALLVLLWLALLAASGIFINHANDWGLDRKPLWSPLQSWVYGVELQESDFCGGVQLPRQECLGIFARLELPGGALLLKQHNIYLADSNGAVLENLPVSQLGLVSLLAAKSVGTKVLLRGADKTIVTDAELLDVRIADPGEVQSAQAYPWQKPGNARAQITWERFFLDLHAARFLGSLSRVFNDLMAGLILLLAVSGFWLHRSKGRKA